MRTLLSLLTAITLAPAAAADSLNRALSQPVECREPEPWRATAKEREPGVLSFRAMGLCRDRTSGYWDYRHCAACGPTQRWDKRLRIWRPNR